MAVTEMRRNDGACERVLRGANPQREDRGWESESRCTVQSIIQRQPPEWLNGGKSNDRAPGEDEEEGISGG